MHVRVNNVGYELWKNDKCSH